MLALGAVAGPLQPGLFSLTGSGYLQNGGRGSGEREILRAEREVVNQKNSLGVKNNFAELYCPLHCEKEKFTAQRED